MRVDFSSADATTPISIWAADANARFDIDEFEVSAAAAMKVTLANGNPNADREYHLPANGGKVGVEMSEPYEGGLNTAITVTSDTVGEVDGHVIFHARN